MIIATAANYRMRGFALSCVKSAEKLGYQVIVYNLGGLGFGKPFAVDNEIFQKDGFYDRINPSRYNRGSHKTEIVKACLRSNREFIVLLDANIVVMDKIDEMVGSYDIGLTIRPEWEVEKVIKKHSHPFIYGGYVNAGVMCFNATEAALRFVDEWEEKTRELHDDQGAINAMLQEFFPLKSGQTIERKGVKIRTFDTPHYNYYYFRWPEIYKS